MTAPTREEMATVRPATTHDLPAVERLLRSSDLPLAGVRAAFDTFVVAEHGGELVGVAGLELCDDNALLRSVAVQPQWRSRGVGRALVTRAIAEAEARGIRALYLLTTTAESYFPTFGFRSVARADVPASVRGTDEFATACPDTAVAMMRPGRATLAGPSGASEKSTAPSPQLSWPSQATVTAKTPSSA